MIHTIRFNFNWIKNDLEWFIPPIFFSVHFSVTLGFLLCPFGHNIKKCPGGTTESNGAIYLSTEVRIS